MNLYGVILGALVIAGVKQILGSMTCVNSSVGFKSGIFAIAGFCAEYIRLGAVPKMDQSAQLGDDYCLEHRQRALS